MGLFLAGRHKLGCRKLPMWLTVIWLFCISASVIFSVDFFQSTRGLLVYCTGLFVFWISGVLSETSDYQNYLIHGFIFGGLVSSLYALYQFIAPRFGIEVNLWLLRNTQSFPLYLPSTYSTWRPFGFTAEPSHLASLQIPLVLILALRSAKGNILTRIQLLIVTSSLISLGSLALLFILPIASFAAAIISHEIRNVFKRIVIPILIIGTILGTLFGIFDQANSPESLINRTLMRFEQVDADNSFVARWTSIQVAWDIFRSHPLFGGGIFATVDEYQKRTELSVEIYGESLGVASQFFSTLADQGIIGLLPLFLVIWLGLKNTSSKPEIKVALVAIVVIAIAQAGHVLLYHFWVFYGLAVGSAMHKRISFVVYRQAEQRQPSTL